jgi:uncharacterized membrane protein YedE/YeeE
MEKQPQPFWNPYLAGVGLGLTLLLSFVLMGRGLGASGAMTRITAYAMTEVAPEHTKKLGYMREYMYEEDHILNEYLVFMLAGVFIGGFVSGALSGRVKTMIEKGPTTSNVLRLSFAFAGGMISAFGARLARGCTSGQALTGGATLALGSWLFMIFAFAGGYAMAWFVRRQWK